MTITKPLVKIIALVAMILPLTTTGASAQPSAKNQKIIDHWTPARMKQAIPRQLVIAPNGLGYLKMPDGSLQPHGHNRLVAASKATPQPQAKPGGGGGDVDGPSISRIEPANNETIGASQRFAATITDASGVRSASLVITYPDGRTQSFGMVNSNGVVWENTLSGFTNGLWAWRVEATDGIKGKGNTTVSSDWGFNVDTSGEPPPPSGGDVVTNAHWTGDDPVRWSVGRIYFEMPTNARLRRWAAYVCSGTVATDDTTGRSVIITAAHCAYDDANKAFARNILFIPNQDATTGSGTDINCGNDPIGCWTPSFAVVDTNWTTSTFPDNIPWDYSYYVVNDSGAHSGAGGDPSLESAADALDISFATPESDVDNSDADYTHAIGYSYADDPNLMYCAEDMTTEGDANWWLPNCGLSGGSSGGPWIQPMTGGDGPIISVNSWGYNSSPGMAGPYLDVTSAECLFGVAKDTLFNSVSDVDGSAGVIVNCD